MSQDLTPNLTNTIQIGNEFLQQKVKRDYSNHKTAIIREFLQNSLDAGSSKVQFDFNYEDRTLIVTDDGSGMNDEIMTNCLFNIGGSYKEDKDSVGGFGAAKMILFFQHEYFKITTWRDGYRYNVDGCASKYSNIDKTEDNHHTGTIVEIKFTDTWAEEVLWDASISDSYSCFKHDALEFLERCEFQGADVTWNGVPVEPLVNGDLIKTLDWCNIYSKELEEGTVNFVTVRIRGIKMFEIYVSNLKKDIIVELTKNSLNILTSNRDGLVYSFRQDLEALIGQINVDKESFTNLKGKKITYQGQENSFTSTCLEAFKEYTAVIIKKIDLKILTLETYP